MGFMKSLSPLSGFGLASRTLGDKGALNLISPGAALLAGKKKDKPRSLISDPSSASGASKSTVY